MYNDAPDEFAEFLDSGRYEVSLSDLGGVNNPFVKEGIYRECCFRAEFAADYYGQYAYCPDCGEKFYFNHDFAKYNCLEWKCDKCGSELFIYENDSIHFAIENARLAEFMSKGLGCSVCRQFKKTGWLFGKLRGYDVYFACVPTEGMYRALESAPKSVLVIGQNNPKNLPPALAPRVIYLSRLLFVKDGALHFANEVVEEKIPMRRDGGSRESGQKGKRAKGNPKRGRIHKYAQHYLTMMAEWFEILRREKRIGRPSIEWMADWLYEHNASPSRKRLSDRQIYRHIKALTEASSKNGKPDRPYAEFVAHWYGCEDSQFVDNFSGKSLADVILKLFPSVKIGGNDIKPMRSMDAAEFADKCDGKFGQKRNFRTHVD